MTGNYILSFEIKPIGVVPGNWANILRFTTGIDHGKIGSRSPAIWFWPGETKLGVYVNDEWYPPTETSYALPLNVFTKVVLEVNGLDMKLTVGQSVYPSKQSYRRFAGSQIVYASDPWHTAANAELINLVYKILPAGLNAGKYDCKLRLLCTST